MEAKQLREESDRCPYSRAFAAGFSDCPTFESVTFIAADSNHNPLEPAITCRHLTVGTSEAPGRFYARCGLGTAADRLRWRTAMGAERVDQMRALQEEFDRCTKPVRKRLLRAKAEVVQSRFAYEPSQRLSMLIKELLAESQAFVREHEESYREAGFDAGAVLSQVEDWTRAWAKSPEVALGWVSADEPGRVPPPGGLVR